MLIIGILSSRNIIICSQTRPCLNRVQARASINFAGLFAPSFFLFPRLKPFYSPLSFDISSFPDIQESHIVLTTFSSPHHSTALKAPQEEQKMRPTSILAGASRIPLTGKRGNKDFYKGQSPPAFFFFSLSISLALRLC